jgi:glycosyltransferase involved in cell wall biosynthesis
MNILHVTQGYFPSIGGTERLIQCVSEELVRQYGDNVTAFTTNCYNGEGFFDPHAKRFPVGWDEVNGVHVRRFPVSSWLSRLLWKPQHIAFTLKLPYNQYLRTWAQGPIIPGLKKAIKEFDSDVIAVSSFPLLHMFVSLKAAREIGRPCIFMGALHPDDQWGFGRPIIYRAIQQATEYIAYTQYEADFVISRGANPKHVHVIGLGVDPAPYDQITQAEAKQRYGFVGDPVVGFVGQVAGHKVEMLLMAMPRVWEQMPEVQLMIAGSKTNYDKKLQSIVRSWPDAFQQKLKLIYGFEESEKPWLYSCVDVFAYPSAWESFGLAYVEAWAAKKPVIGCFRGAVPWVVSAGRDGLLVNLHDYNMLAEAIKILLKTPAMAKDMGEAGYRKVMQKHTWDLVSRRFRQVYEGALHDRK